MHCTTYPIEGINNVPLQFNYRSPIDGELHTVYTNLSTHMRRLVSDKYRMAWLEDVMVTHERCKFDPMGQTNNTNN